MDRAAKVALKMYPLDKFDGEIGDSMRAACYVGYMQAMYDLALTWEDVNLIDSILIDMQDEGVEKFGGLRQYYEETLNRFNEIRKK